MSRRKDEEWNLPENITWDHVSIAVLMDIRDELKRLNQLLHCPNFIAIPSTLNLILNRIAIQGAKKRKVTSGPMKFPGSEKQRKARPIVQ